MVYLFGGAAEHYEHWHDYTVEDRARLVKEIQARAILKRAGGITLGLAMQAQRCDSWNQAVYDRLILEGHDHFELIPWAAATKKAMMTVGSHKKKAALLGHGLLPVDDYCKAMVTFKASKFYPVKPKPKTRKEDKAIWTAALRQWETDVETAKLQYVCEFPFPNQGKGTVHSVRRRLASCLYYIEITRVKTLNTALKKRKKTEDEQDDPLEIEDEQDDPLEGED